MAAAWAAFFLASQAASVLAAPLELRVDCSDGGADLPTLHAARDALRAAFSVADSQGKTRPSARVSVRGPCYIHTPLVFDKRDSGDVEWLPEAPAATFVVSGGAPVPAAWLTPVVDPNVLAQLPATARDYVQQLNLTAHGFSAGAGPISGRGCRVYAEGLPEPHGGSMPGGSINSPPNLEFFAVAGCAGGGQSCAVEPLALARWPNAEWNPANWSRVLHSAPPTDRTFGPDPATLARSTAWAQQFREDAGSIYVHQYNRVGWADMHWQLTGLTPRNMTFGDCGNMSIGEVG